MNELYDKHGIQFRYPADWELAEQATENGVSVLVQSSETSFWSVFLDSDGPDPENMLDAALEAFRLEYSEVDDYPPESGFCHRGAVGRIVEFLCLDWVNTACLRAFRTSQFSVLVLYQATDREFQKTRSRLEAMTRSLTCSGDEPPFPGG
ncbi:MAG: hypothetical protein ACE5KM_02545 [Planctomycetaceae bacterium]